MSQISHFHFITPDKLKLCVESRFSTTAKTVLIFIHGLNEYVGRYTNVLNYFGKTHTVYFYDQRGHGFSDGPRAFVKKFSDYVDDLKIFIDLVCEKNPHQKIFAIGHSLGGQILINYLAQEQSSPLAGAIFSSPNIKIQMKISGVKKFVGEQLATLTPKLRLPSEVDPKWLTHDEDSVEAYKKDKMIPKFITAGLAVEMLKNQENILSLAEKISLPVLMMHAGEDRICSKEAAEGFFKKLASQDKKLKIYDGFYHELFNEVSKEKVLGDMEGWVESQA